MKRGFLAGFLVSLAFIAVIAFFGCSTTSGGGATPVVNQTVVTDIQAAGQLIGGGAKAFLPLAGPTGTTIDAGIGLFCSLKLPAGATATQETAALAAMQADLQKLWTQFNSYNTQTANEIVLAINSAWTMVSTAVANAGDVSIGIQYLSAFTSGICNGYNGTLAGVVGGWQFSANEAVVGFRRAV